MIVAAQEAPAPNLESSQDARHLRHLALDAVARFRQVVDAADFAMFEQGASDLKGWRLERLKEQYQGPVEQAAKEVEAAIEAAHLAATGGTFNPHVITDEGDVLLLQTEYNPLPDEESYFDWPFTWIRTSMAVRPDR